jgi:hypothetical protein
MVVVRGVERSELPVVERYIYVEKRDEMAVSGGLDTHLRRRAKSKSLVRD